jgi:4-carboxymuconolactone decarboxylase
MEKLSNSSVMEKEAAKEAGLEILRKLGWPLDTGHLFGQVWARPGLSLRDRAMITLAVLLAVDADRGSMNHLRYAHNVGITEEEVRELIIQVGFYAGWPKGAHAMARFSAILAEPGNGYNNKTTDMGENKKETK